MRGHFANVPFGTLRGWLRELYVFLTAAADGCAATLEESWETWVVGTSTFEVLYRRNWRYVRTVVAALGVPGRDLDDLCHDVFVIAWKKVAAADLQPGTERFWLRQIGYYLATAYKRRKVRRLETLVDEPADVQSSMSAQREFAQFEQSDVLQVAYSGLSTRDADLLALHVVGDLSFRTLGEICECDPKTARKRFLAALQRARSATRDGTPMLPNRALADTPWASRPLGRERVVCKPARLASQLELRASDDCVAIGLAGRVVVTHWYGTVTSSALDLLLVETREIRDRLPGKFGYFAIVEDGCRPPGFDDRAKILELLRFFRADVAAYATASSLDSLVIPIMSALTALARIPFPVRFVTNLQDAAAWLFSTMGDGTGLSSAGALVKAASALRAERGNARAALAPAVHY